MYMDQKFIKIAIFLLFRSLSNFGSEKSYLTLIGLILPEIQALEIWYKLVKLRNEIVKTCQFLSNFETPPILIELRYQHDLNRINFLIDK